MTGVTSLGHSVDDSCDVNVHISDRKTERLGGPDSGFPTILFRELTLVLYEGLGLFLTRTLNGPRLSHTRILEETKTLSKPQHLVGLLDRTLRCLS